jgi:hypothetical protein
MTDSSFTDRPFTPAGSVGIAPVDTSFRNAMPMRAAIIRSRNRRRRIDYRVE